MDDTVTVSRAQARLLLAGVAVASGCLGLFREQISVEEFATLLAIFSGRVSEMDPQWLLDLAMQVESAPPPPGTVWH